MCTPLCTWESSSCSISNEFPQSWGEIYGQFTILYQIAHLDKARIRLKNLIV